MAATVVMTDNIFSSLDEFHHELKPLGLEVQVAPASDEATLIGLARSAVAMIVVYAQITEPVIATAASAGCRVISRCGIGYDNINIEAATRHRLQVTYVPDYCLDEVADHTIALLLAFARGLVPAAIAIRDGSWQAPREGVHRLRGRQLTLLGAGRIGRRVATRALALGLRVTAYDPFVTDWEEAGVNLSATLEEALAGADFVSLHAPLTTENHHLVNAHTIALMDQKPVLINTARGGLIDLDAVTSALDQGSLCGVALDVFETEPLPSDHLLRTHPRSLVTPHVAYYSVESESELKRRAAEEVARAVRGEPPRCPVNRLEASDAR
jgi:phosphoglycerate dehydrogenase-like enzyme